MALSIVASICLLLSSDYAYAGATASTLSLEQSIPLPDVVGRIDHMAIDVKERRLFVAELGNNSLDVIDLRTDKVIQRISGMKEPQGVAYIADHDQIVAANGGDGSLRFYRAGDGVLLGNIALGDDADNVHIDSSTGHLIVGYGDGALALVDPTTRSKIAYIKLPGHPEGFQIDVARAKVFINVPDADQIIVADLTSYEVQASWPTSGASSNFPMAIDHGSSRIATVFRHPSKLEILDEATGAQTGSIETCGDADDVFFDDKRQRIYVSCGEGVIDVIQRDGDSLHSLERVATSNGARTSLFVPELDRLFVAARGPWYGPGAAIMVFRPTS